MGEGVVWGTGGGGLGGSLGGEVWGDQKNRESEDAVFGQLLSHCLVSPPPPRTNSFLPTSRVQQQNVGPAANSYTLLSAFFRELGAVLCCARRWAWHLSTRAGGGGVVERGQRVCILSLNSTGMIMMITPEPQPPVFLPSGTWDDAEYDMIGEKTTHPLP